MRCTNLSDHQSPRSEGGHEAGSFFSRCQWGQVGRLAQNLPSASFLPVSPNRTTHPRGGSWPCEQVVADIENKTSLAIVLDKYDEVCARLMQAKKNRRFFSGMAGLELAAVLMNVLLASLLAHNTSGRMRHGFLAALGGVSGIPHLMVSQQFHRIKQKCEDALRMRFGDGFYHEIDRLVRDEEGFQKAILLLRAQGGDTDFLEKKLAEFQEREYSSSWVARILMDFAQWAR